MAGTTGGVGAMAGLNEFDLAAFVVASCERHGVPVKIADPLVHGRVALLLSGRSGPGAAERDPDRRAVSESPDEIDAFGVEAASSDLRGCDDGVVEHRSHDGVLAVQDEIGPLSA